MITENFLDRCLFILSSWENTKDRKFQDFLLNVTKIFDIYINENEYNKSKIEFSDKFEAVAAFVKFRNMKVNSEFDEQTFEKFLEKIKSGKLKNLVPFIRNIRNDITQKDFSDNIEYVISIRKIFELTVGKKNLEFLLKDIDIGNYNDITDIMNKWESTISNIHENILHIKKIETISDNLRLDILNDDFSEVIDKIKRSSDKSIVMKTGFEFFDSYLNSGGLENGRLYLIGGSSGIGKSIILINFIANAVMNTSSINTDEMETFLYITAENLIDESLVRFYCCITDTPVEDFKEIIFKDKNFNLKNELVKKFKDKNKNVIFHYVQARNTTIDDIRGIVNDVTSTYKLRGLFIDYLDLIVTGNKTSEERIMQGDVAMAFKNIAVEYEIPVITATQLNREGYKPDLDPSLTQMGESMKKIDNSDCVIFLQKTKNIERTIFESNGASVTGKEIRVTVLKNRSGPTENKCVMFLPRIRGSKNIFSFRLKEIPDLFMSEKTIDLGGYTDTTNDNSDEYYQDDIIDNNDKNSIEKDEHVFF